MGDNTSSRILNQVGNDRRIAFFKWENKMLKWAIGAIILSLGSAITVGVQWNRLDIVAEEIAGMPSKEVVIQKEETHKQVHVTQAQEFEYIKEHVEEIREQQTKTALQVANTEKNVWKIVQKLNIE